MGTGTHLLNGNYLVVMTLNTLTCIYFNLMSTIDYRAHIIFQKPKKTLNKYHSHYLTCAMMRSSLVCQLVDL